MKIRAILISLVLSMTVSTVGYAKELYVVVSNNLRGESFSSDQVKRILLGETSNIKNARVNLIYPSYSSSEISILSKFVGKGDNVRNLKAYWSKMIFTGKGTPPLTAENEEDLKRLIARDNSIGVSKSSEGMHVIYTISD